MDCHDFDSENVFRHVINKQSNSGMGETLGTPVHQGLKARTEESRVVAMPHAAK